MDPTPELVRQCMNGDPIAFEKLVREHMNTVLGLAYNYVGNFSAAEDIAQETFVQAFQSLSSLRDGGRFKIWLLKIARNKCIDAIRRNPHWISLDQHQELQKEIARKSASARDDLGAQFSEEDLLKAMQSLREDYREIFVMKHVDNLSYKEISAVGEKLYRVRSMMREKLEDMRFRSNES